VFLILKLFKVGLMQDLPTGKLRVKVDDGEEVPMPSKLKCPSTLTCLAWASPMMGAMIETTPTVVSS
jgi:hypothetical protein